MAWHPTWNDDSDQPQRGRYRYIRFGGGMRRGGTPGMWWILGLCAAVFILFQGGSGGMARLVYTYGPLTANDVMLRGQVWRLVTFQFMHGDFGHIFWNMFILWMFGRVVEMQIGTRRFVWMYLLSGVFGGLCECALNFAIQAGGQPGYADIPIVGASAGVAGSVIAFAILHPSAPILLMFILPVRARYVAIGYFVIESFNAVSSLMQSLETGVSGTSVAHAAHAGGMLFAGLCMIVFGYINRPWANGIRAAWAGLTRRARSAKPRGPSRTVRRDHPVVGGPNSGAGPSRPRSRDEARLDDILRKIHEKGLLSLSESERKFLRDMSEKKRDDTDFDDRYRRG